MAWKINIGCFVSSSSSKHHHHVAVVGRRRWSLLKILSSTLLHTCQGNLPVRRAPNRTRTTLTGAMVPQVTALMS